MGARFPTGARSRARAKLDRPAGHTENGPVSARFRGPARCERRFLALVFPIPAIMSEGDRVVPQDRAERGGVFDPQFEVAVGSERNRWRRGRFKRFLPMLERAAAGGKTVRILDVGGAPGFWMSEEDLWGHLSLDITMVNIGAHAEDRPPYKLRPGDACNLSEYPDMSFDLVHSNSVIEHVGHWREMRAMAREVRRLAPHYWVQTPNFWFPYEPHYKSLFLHWYPEDIRAKMLLRKKRGWIEADTFDKAMTEVQDLCLVSARQMAELFPDARIERERVGPFTKSLIAVR